MGGIAIGVSCALVLALVAGVVIRRFGQRARQVAAERRRRMQDAARRLGLRYWGRAEADALKFLPECSLFRRGDVPALGNLIGEDRRPPSRLLFDYAFTGRWHGRSAPELDIRVLNLVAMVRLEAPAPVAARLYREDWFGGPVGVRGLYRLEFEKHDPFASNYWVGGEPREAVRAMLTGPVREALYGWQVRGPRPVVEVLPDWVVVYVESEPGDGAVARKAVDLLAYASSIAGALRAAPAHTREESEA